MGGRYRLELRRGLQLGLRLGCTRPEFPVDH